MPSDLENAKLMFLCLQYSHATGFNYKSIGEACGISTNAASKRMVRLRQAVKEGKESSLDVRFLWACVQNSNLGTINFQGIAKELNVTANAASKRWTRLKQALERGETGGTAPPTAEDSAAATGKESNKAAPAAAKDKKKRKATSIEDDEEAGNEAVKKKGRNKPAVAATAIKTEDDGDDVDAEGEIDDTYNVASAEEPATTKTKPTAAAAKKKAATAGPKKLTTAAAATRKTKSTPRRRGNQPMTDQEVYAKVEVPEDDDNNEKPPKVYPKHHNLLQTFQAVRTPGKDEWGSAVGSPASTATIAGGDNVFYFSPTDSSADGMDDNGSRRGSSTVQDVFTQIADAAMQSPSKAERAAAEKASGEQKWDGEVDRTAKMPNPFMSGGASGASSSFHDGFEDEYGPGPDEEYC